MLRISHETMRGDGTIREPSDSVGPETRRLGTDTAVEEVADWRADGPFVPSLTQPEVSKHSDYITNVVCESPPFRIHAQNQNPLIIRIVADSVTEASSERRDPSRKMSCPR